MTNLYFTLQAGNVLPPKNWKDIVLKMELNDNNQPHIEADEIIFINRHIEVLQNQLDFAGIYSGLDFNIGLSDGVNDPLSLGGYLDLTTLKKDSPTQWRSKFYDSNALELLDNKFRSNSFAYLVNRGRITKNDFVDIPVVIQKKFDGTEVAFASLFLFIITKTIYETYRDAWDKIAEATAAIVPGSVQAYVIIKQIATIIYILAYYALLLISLYQILKVLRQNFFPRVTKYKGIRLKTMVQKLCEELDLTLDCDIEDLNDFVYLPSKTNPHVSRNKNDEGIPNAQDFGYNGAELLQLVFDLFDAKFTIKGKTMYIRNQYSSFWWGNSKNIMPSHIDLDKYSYNANELYANRLIRFQYDSSDEHTLPSINKHADDWSRGTNFEMITDIDNGGEQISKMIKGFKETSIPMSLGRRRTNLSTTEEILKGAFTAVDQLIKIFGGGTPFTDSININKGALLISQNSFNNAKLIYLDDKGYIPPYHRDYLGAEALWNNYYKNTSFKTNSSENQRLIFTDVKIPMNFDKFVNYKDSPFFTIENDNSPFGGKRGKLLSLRWPLGSESGIATFYIESEYMKPSLLKETPIGT